MFRRNGLFSRLVWIGASLGTLSLLGCGGDGTYHVSGKVTFKGQPVPAGKVFFLPDGTKGNSGPAGYADIKDGEYNTASGGKKAKAGAIIFAVEGFDPKSPPKKIDRKADPEGEITTTILFARYEKQIELPTAASTQNIDVPADAAKGPKTAKETGGGIVP